MRNILAVILALLIIPAAWAEVWQVEETSENKTTVYDVEIITQKSGAGYKTTYITPKGTETVFYTDSGASYKESTITDQTVSRKGNTISFSSHQPVICSKLPWYGNFHLAAKAAVLNKRSQEFLAVDDEKGRVTRMFADLSAVPGKKDQFKVRISLPGDAAEYWSIEFFLNGDGDILKYIGNTGPGTPEIIQVFSRK